MIDWKNLEMVDWSELQSTADWVKTLNELLELAKSADADKKRSALADVLDSFADNSSADDLTTITKLDAAARKAARGLRIVDIERCIKELEAASGDFRATVKELDAVTTGLKKETRLLRAKKVTAAVSALTGTIEALNDLTKSTSDQDSDKLAAAIREAVECAQKLRGILETPA